jgi:hypothetical protein
MLVEDDKFQQDIWGIVAPTPRGSKEIISYLSPFNIIARRENGTERMGQMLT